MARAFGSYPNCRWFKSDCRYHFKREALRHFYSSAASNLFLTHKLIWPGGQAVKTPPFHGGNTSSILVRVTTKSIQPIGWVFFTFLRHNYLVRYCKNSYFHFTSVLKTKARRGILILYIAIWQCANIIVNKKQS